MKIYNKEFNTYPICVHFNGGRIKRTQQWKDFLLSYKENKVIKPKELAIVTFNNKAEWTIKSLKMVACRPRYHFPKTR
jgi:hypothetical protein